jgi:hypothetical protein
VQPPRDHGHVFVAAAATVRCIAGVAEPELSSTERLLGRDRAECNQRGDESGATAVSAVVRLIEAGAGRHIEIPVDLDDEFDEVPVDRSP